MKEFQSTSVPKLQHNEQRLDTEASSNVHARYLPKCLAAISPLSVFWRSCSTHPTQPGRLSPPSMDILTKGDGEVN